MRNFVELNNEELMEVNGGQLVQIKSDWKLGTTTVKTFLSTTGKTGIVNAYPSTGVFRTSFGGQTYNAQNWKDLNSNTIYTITWR